MATPEQTKEPTINSTISAAENAWHGQRPNADEIPCPALLAFYNNGWLNPDNEGNVAIAQLDEVLARVGISVKIREALEKGADKTDDVPNSFNLFKLRGSSLDHSGSTGIRDPSVDPEKLESALLKFSENGRMYARHFASAANQANRQDPGLRGTLTQTLEFTSILEVFGRLDDSRSRYLTVEDIKALWIDGKFPKDWRPRATNEINVSHVALGMGEMVVQRVLKAIGF